MKLDQQNAKNWLNFINFWTLYLLYTHLIWYFGLFTFPLHSDKFILTLLKLDIQQAFDKVRHPGLL